MTNRPRRESGEELNVDPNLVAAEEKFFCYAASLGMHPNHKKFGFWKGTSKVILFASIRSFAMANVMVMSFTGRDVPEGVPRNPCNSAQHARAKAMEMHCWASTPGSTCCDSCDLGK